ncbi:hypothetical protein acsn021_34030 [Anaerocolumna cellulosilytica]|uniref:Uncharacterized protein n=1 Tax=Anaerocolumna cellulosilytica TaxID=433286 RepID=A0A6S6QYX2_9FIRM|nr:hypothetical protein acsn021_34030 [Anaerocolumna cellulosilytica]
MRNKQYTYAAHICTTKNPLKIKGFFKRETGFEDFTISQNQVKKGG